MRRLIRSAKCGRCYWSRTFADYLPYNDETVNLLIDSHAASGCDSMMHIDCVSDGPIEVDE